MDRFTSDIAVVTRFKGQGRIRRTREGGLAIRLTNGSGVASVKGKLVVADTNADEAVDVCGADDTDVIGAFYESGIADGKEVWVVVYGVADVLLKDNEGSTHGNWVGSSSEAGYAYATENSPPAQPTHFREIGHCLKTCAAEGGGTHVLCRIMMHFN